MHNGHHSKRGSSDSSKQQLLQHLTGVATVAKRNLSSGSDNATAAANGPQLTYLMGNAKTANDGQMLLLQLG
jgi:hypothetical protein